MNDIEKNPDFNGLRVRILTDAGTETLPPQETEEIPPSEKHGGLRVKTLRHSEAERSALES
jgi:hypothetical protein